jgi:sn-glycerol 3-phosphate transport system permease protein
MVGGRVRELTGVAAPSSPAVGLSLRRRLLPIAEAVTGYGFLAPSLLVFATFVFYPLIKSIYLGFYVSNPFGTGQVYVGTDQYRQVLGSADFHRALKTTASFAMYTVGAGVTLGLLFALLANARLRGMLIFRTIFSSTIATSVAVASLMWLLMFNPSVGILNYLLSLINAAPVHWLTSPRWALFSVSMATVWLQLGFNIVVLLAGLQSIPETLYESAKVDGAGPVRQFFSITLPMLSPTLFFVIVISTIRAFESFGQIDLLTQGGPNGSTFTMVYAIYRNAFFNFGAVGVASAQAVVLFLVILMLTAVQFGVAERKVFYQ